MWAVLLNYSNYTMMYGGSAIDVALIHLFLNWQPYNPSPTIYSLNSLNMSKIYWEDWASPSLKKNAFTILPPLAKCQPQWGQALGSSTSRAG